MNASAVRLDLGIRALLPQWRALIAPRHWRDDLVAGITVGCVAIPLSLAIALASGVEPAVGLVTAIVAGIVAALFGGTPLAVSGPAAAMAVLVGAVVESQGVAGLLVVGFACGVLQLVTGIFGLGRFIRLVPLPVIEGFTAGIGAIILIGQLPRALGLPPPAESHVLDVLTHLRDLLHETHFGALAIVVGTVALVYALPRLTKRIPAQLVAVVVPTAIVAASGLNVPLIGEIPRSLPAPKLPAFPANVDVRELAAAAFLVYALASLETLLSSTAVEKLAHGSRTDPDQELVGQGLANMTSVLFGGIPVTGVIARSATNVQAGAKTRRASIIHSLVLIATVFAFAPVMARIPIAALAGVLITVAFRMLSPATFMRLLKTSRADAAVFLTTFVVIVFVDLLEGVQWGVLAALAIAAIRLGRGRAVIHGTKLGSHYEFHLQGPVTFLASLQLETLRKEADRVEPGRAVIMDLHDVTVMDSSGAEMLAGVVEDLRARDVRVALVGVSEAHRVYFLGVDPTGELRKLIANTESDAVRLVGIDELGRSEVRLRSGVERYLTGSRPRYAELFQKLAEGQAPHTLFITCSDSRVHPNLITATEPGELFIVRDVGNMVVPCRHGHAPASGAAIDYAVGILGVRQIVVCGHSSCGAIRALLSDSQPPEHLASLHEWLRVTDARRLVGRLPSALEPDTVARLNVLAQIDNLKTYSCVRDKLATGELTLAAWFFDIRTGEVSEWSDATQRFVAMEAGQGSGTSGEVEAVPSGRASSVQIVERRPSAKKVSGA